MIRRINSKIPLKDFKTETRISNPQDVDPELLKVMQQYQKRGADYMKTLFKQQDLQAQNQPNTDESKQVDSEAFIVKGERPSNNSGLDNKPKRKILTRQQFLASIRK